MAFGGQVHVVHLVEFAAQRLGIQEVTANQITLLGVKFSPLAVRISAQIVASRRRISCVPNRICAGTKFGSPR